MRYEGVTFLVDACAKMSKAEFVKFHVDAFWLDREKPIRKKMLEDVYDRMFGKKDESDNGSEAKE